MSSKQEYNKERAIENLAIKRVIQDVAITPEGKAFFFWFMKTCGYQSSSIAYDETNKIDKDGLLINEALRRMYLNVRTLLPKHILPEIENLDLIKYAVETLKITVEEKKEGD